MASFVATTFILAFSLLPQGSSASTLNGPSVVRRESDHMLQVDAEGSVIEQTPIVLPHGASRPTETFCDSEYVLGEEGDSLCDTSRELAGILEKAKCIQAADEHNAKTDSLNFEIQGEWRKVHPRGCFKDGCQRADGTQTGEVCYWFNGLGYEPNGTYLAKDDDGGNRHLGIIGAPVCSMARYVNATTKDADNSCPTNFSVVHGDTWCRSVADCIGRVPAGDFHIGLDPAPMNQSKHLDHVSGCFINEQDGLVYYNAPTELGLGAKPKGINLCNVTTRVNWAPHHAAIAAATAAAAPAAPAGNSTP